MVSWTDFNQISYKTNFDSKAVYVSIQHGFVKFLCRNLFTITLHCSSHSGSGQKVCKCTFQNEAAACWQVNAVWSACLQSVLPNQTMRLLPSLLQFIFLPTHQHTQNVNNFSADFTNGGFVTTIHANISINVVAASAKIMGR